MKQLIRLEEIRINGGTQPRAELNQETIQEYTENLKEKHKFPVVLVVYDGENYWLADGFHRLHAYKNRNKKKIPCEIIQGTRRDAVLESVGVNAKHGLRRTNADKRRAVTKLLEDEEWSKWSDHEIARKTNTSDFLVRKLRGELTTINCSDNQERIYTDKYGNETTMDISKIGGGKVQEEPKEEPEEDEEQKEDEEKQETTPKIKSKIKEVNNAIESGEVDFKDLQRTRKALHKSDSDGKQQEKFKGNFKQKSRIEKLHDKLHSITDELTYFSDGTIPVEEDDGPWITGIKAKGPDFITQFYKMGVDPIRVWNLLNPNKEISYESEREEGKERNSSEGVINITPGEDS